MIAGLIAGGLVVFLTEFGLLEFLGTLLEPIMRVLFKVPGKSAIDALSSFVCSPSVGVMITDGLYRRGVYTDKEACSITTNFSIASLGGFAFLSGIAGVGHYYSQIVLSAFILVFVVAAIIIRIPPISKKEDKFYDGTIQSPEERKAGKYDKYVFRDAMAVGGTGIGNSQSCGYGLLLDGSEEVDEIIKRAINYDVMCGIARRAWARNKHSIETALEHKAKDDNITIPYICDDEDIMKFIES